jgi:hypothetical protein
MKLKVIIAVVIILLLVGAVIVDAKGKSGGGKSGSGSKSFSQKSSSVSDGLSGKAAGVASLPFLAKSAKKKTHLDDDLFENETEEELEEQQQQSPGPGVLPAFMAMGLLFIAWRGRKGR